MSWMARRIVGVLLGSTVRDVNIPFRLMRSGILSDILPVIPAKTFAPNVPISGAISRTASMAGNILFIVFTSMIFAYATALSGVGEDLVGMLEDANVSRLTFLLIIMVVFAILGCFMEGLGMIAIIVPINPAIT